MLYGTVVMRAINYFTVWELLDHKTTLVSETWQKLRTLTTLDVPLAVDAFVFASPKGVDSAQFHRVQGQVEKSFQNLHPDDAVLERGAHDYPHQLALTDDAPEYLFVRGNVALLHEPAIAVVGTRNPTDDGRRRARKLGYLLADRGIIVSSGLALGIDAAAHTGALRVGGNTFAVIGTPLHKVYPREHNELQELIARVGAVVTQFYPGAAVTKFNVPMRNAVMSGLSLGTVVVEAGETSGALIQARKCLQQGRKLFIPQSAVDNPAITWPKTFLNRGAVRFSTIEEVMEAIEEFLPRGNSSNTPFQGDIEVCSLKLTTLPR